MELLISTLIGKGISVLIFAAIAGSVSLGGWIANHVGRYPIHPASQGKKRLANTIVVLFVLALWVVLGLIIGIIFS